MKLKHSFRYICPKNILHTDLPIALIDSLEGLPGFERDAFINVHKNSDRITSIRINPAKINIAEKKSASQQTPGHSITQLPNQPVTQLSILPPIPWCPYGFYIPERPAFTLDPLLHAGAYYVQEASSMLIWEMLRQAVGSNTHCRVLDLCAAPGGKSTLLASYFTDGLIVSNEVIKQRVSILYENITKWGHANTVITNNDAADFARLENYFDVLLIDAPCSGSGLFRKDANAVHEWSTGNVNLCSGRQQRIIADALPALKQNGLLIYSTCSYSREENEDILKWMLHEFALETVDIDFPPEWGVTKTGSGNTNAAGFRCWPHKMKGEGFFIAALRKKSGEAEHTFYLREKNKKEKIPPIENWVNTGNHAIFNHKENIHAIPAGFASDVKLLQDKLYVKKAGILCGVFKGSDFIPHHELALSSLLSSNAERIHFSYDEALAYLRKQDTGIAFSKKGWAVAVYNNAVLGCMKLLPGRINNYYPAEWRILKQ